MTDGYGNGFQDAQIQMLKDEFSEIKGKLDSIQQSISELPCDVRKEQIKNLRYATDDFREKIYPTWKSIMIYFIAPFSLAALGTAITLIVKSIV